MSHLLPGMLHTVLSPAECGTAKIVMDSPSQLDRLRGAMSGQPLTAQTYTRLLINGSCWMTDAEFEVITHGRVVRLLYGDVLVGGLGLGFILMPLIKTAAVTTITVLEKSADVINLVSPQIKADKLKVIQADVFKWSPPKKAFDCAYFDIWENVPNEDQRDEIKQLKAHYKPSLKRGGRTYCWCENMIGRR